MGKVIALAHTKGGVGKSTLACQLAVLAPEVLLIDADPQGTTTLFAAARREAGRDGITCVRLSGRTVHKDIRQLSGKHGLVIVDVGGRDSMTLRSVLIAADLALIPVAPRGPELWATDDIASVLSEVRTVNESLKAISVLNRADPKRGFAQSSRVTEASEYLSDTEGIAPSGVTIGNRVAFADAITAGLGVGELARPDNAAILEVNRLYDTVMTQLQ